MPTVLRHAGLRFMIYVDDHPPPHVHVEGKGGYAKIALAGPTLVWNRGIARGDMIIAIDTIRSRRTILMDVWTTLHG